jgi:hypothetical protein
MPPALRTKYAFMRPSRYPVHCHCNTLSQLLAEAVVVVRLAGMGIIVRRLSGYTSPRARPWSGFALAGIGVLIAALKDILTH